MPGVVVVVWLVSWQLGRYSKNMAHNGAKAGFITSPTHSSSYSRTCRYVFLTLLVSVVVVSYYCWTTTISNSMLQERVDRLARDFSLMRSQRNVAEKNFGDCKNRVSM